MQLLFSLVLALTVAAPILAGVVWAIRSRVYYTQPRITRVYRGRRAAHDNGDPPWWAWVLLLLAFGASFCGSLHLL